VVKKLSSMLLIISSNLRIGTENESVFSGTKGRAQVKND